MTRLPLNVPSYHVPVAGFNQAVLAPATGRVLYVSGLTARDASGVVQCVGDVEGQTRAILDSLSRIVGSAGGTLNDVVRIVTYLTRMEDHPRVHVIRREYFGESPPASTSVEISRLYDDRQLIEIEATAVVPDE